MSKHTPGPWRAEPSGDWTDVTWADKRPYQTPVALVARSRDVPLIVAAPKMLEALRMADAAMEYLPGKAARAVAAAIAKAEGRDE